MFSIAMTIVTFSLIMYPFGGDNRVKVFLFLSGKYSARNELTPVERKFFPF